MVLFSAAVVFAFGTFWTFAVFTGGDTIRFAFITGIGIYDDASCVIAVNGRVFACGKVALVTVPIVVAIANANMYSQIISIRAFIALVSSSRVPPSP